MYNFCLYEIVEARKLYFLLVGLRVLFYVNGVYCFFIFLENLFFDFLDMFNLELLLSIVLFI